MSRVHSQIIVYFFVNKLHFLSKNRACWYDLALELVLLISHLIEKLAILAERIDKDTENTNTGLNTDEVKQKKD